MAAKKASATSREVLGDWSNLKGTHYHLVYVLWLLLKREAEQVVFFAGNDLLARPVALQAHTSTRDVWVQLKATEDAWTPSALDGQKAKTIIWTWNMAPWEVQWATTSRMSFRLCV